MKATLYLLRSYRYSQYSLFLDTFGNMITACNFGILYRTIQNLLRDTVTGIIRNGHVGYLHIYVVRETNRGITSFIVMLLTPDNSLQGWVSGHESESRPVDQKKSECIVGGRAS